MSAHNDIIFDELKKAREILENGFEKGEYSRFELALLAKLWAYEGQSKNKIKKSLIDFCIQKSAEFNIVIAREEIDRAVSVSQKYDLKTGNNFVGITQLELDMILSLPHRYAKVMFVMLVLAKINKKYPTRKNKKGNTSSDRYYSQTNLIGVMNIAKTYLAPSELLKALQFLDNDVKFISPTYYNDSTYEIFVVEDGGEEVLIVDDLDNIIDFFPIVCQNCGKPIVRKSGRQKYCAECWKEKHRTEMRNRYIKVK